jgi:hypothetical protein
MPTIAQLAVLFAFLLNALNCAMAVDNAQMHMASIEPGHRGDPGPAEIDRPEAADLSAVVLTPRSGVVTNEAEPTRGVALPAFGHLAAPPTRPRVAAMPYTRPCVSPTQPLDLFRRTPTALPPPHENEDCQQLREGLSLDTNEHGPQTHESERGGYSSLNSRKDPS